MSCKDIANLTEDKRELERKLSILEKSHSQHQSRWKEQLRKLQSQLEEKESRVSQLTKSLVDQRKLLDAQNIYSMRFRSVPHTNASVDQHSIGTMTINTEELVNEPEEVACELKTSDAKEEEIEVNENIFNNNIGDVNALDRIWIQMPVATAKTDSVEQKLSKDQYVPINPFACLSMEEFE
ncbi:hypothetical protein Ciccas_009646 [Cichlidogyrus casuarinus]|uniref:Uncharacterized protein n=1 Tax=Cichlidogyrus casuarinus TaxID=1844966 RepID=A0ABD2PWE1_9PLAT